MTNNATLFVIIIVENCYFVFSLCYSCSNIRLFAFLLQSDFLFIGFQSHNFSSRISYSNSCYNTLSSLGGLSLNTSLPISNTGCSLVSRRLCNGIVNHGASLLNSVVHSSSDGMFKFSISHGNINLMKFKLFWNYSKSYFPSHGIYSVSSVLLWRFRKV